MPFSKQKKSERCEHKTDTFGHRERALESRLVKRIEHGFAASFPARPHLLQVLAQHQRMKSNRILFIYHIKNAWSGTRGYLVDSR
jgi:hypothetical protein